MGPAGRAGTLVPPPPAAPMTRLTALVPLLLALAACDAAGPVGEPDAPDTAALAAPFIDVRLPLGGAPRADVVYALAPLAAGDRFLASTALGSGAVATLVNRAGGDGVALALAVDGVSADSVTVEYLAHGVPVAPPVVHRRAAARSSARALAAEDPPSDEFPGGTAESPPSSYHYEKQNGKWVVVQDYAGATSESARSSTSAAGTRFVTVGGHRARVTHVAFTVHGPDPGPAVEARFQSPVPFSVVRADVASP